MNKVFVLFCTAALILIISGSASQAKVYKVSFNNPADSAQKECTGNIESKKGKTVKVNMSDFTILPEVGVSGILAKYFEEEILGMNTHGYIDIAEVEVKDVSENVVTFTILKELTNIKINGKKENLFKQGIPVKFAW